MERHREKTDAKFSTEKVSEKKRGERGKMSAGSEGKAVFQSFHMPSVYKAGYTY